MEKLSQDQAYVMGAQIAEHLFELEKDAGWRDVAGGLAIAGAGMASSGAKAGVGDDALKYLNKANSGAATAQHYVSRTPPKFSPMRDAAKLMRQGESRGNLESRVDTLVGNHLQGKTAPPSVGNGNEGILDSMGSYLTNKYHSTFPSKPPLRNIDESLVTTNSLHANPLSRIADKAENAQRHIRLKEQVMQKLRNAGNKPTHMPTNTTKESGVDINDIDISSLLD